MKLKRLTPNIYSSLIIDEISKYDKHHIHWILIKIKIMLICDILHLIIMKLWQSGYYLLCLYFSAPTFPPQIDNMWLNQLFIVQKCIKHCGKYSVNYWVAFVFKVSNSEFSTWQAHGFDHEILKSRNKTQRKAFIT